MAVYRGVVQSAWSTGEDTLGFTFDEGVRMAAFRHLAPLDAMDDPMLVRIAQLASCVTGSPNAGLHFFDEELQHRIAAHGVSLATWPREDSMCRLVVEHHEPIETADATTDERFLYSSLVRGDTPVRYYASYPIAADRQAVIGTVCVWDHIPHHDLPSNLEALEHLAALADSRLELLRANLILAEAAMTDPLTGLGNRRMFLELLSHAIAAKSRYGRNVAVLFLDLDGFKQVNDRLGHDAGDEVLAEVAERLRHAQRATDVVARLGGDEFVMLLEEADEVSALAVAGRIAAAIEEPIMTNAGEARVGTSIGVASATSEESPDQLVCRADLNMYAVKAGRKRTLARANHH